MVPLRCKSGVTCIKTFMSVNTLSEIVLRGCGSWEGWGGGGGVGGGVTDILELM